MPQATRTDVTRSTLRNQADALIYSVEKTFTENKTKLEATDVSLLRRGARGRQAGREGRGRRGDSCGDERVAAGLARDKPEALYKANQGQAADRRPHMITRPT